MRTQFLLTFFFVLTFFGLSQLNNANKAFAQGTPTPNLQCKVDKALVNGVEISKDSIPSDTPFGLYIYCLDPTGAVVSGDYQTIIFWNFQQSALVSSQTVTATRDFNVLFGNPFLSLGGGNGTLSGTTGSGTAYPVIVQQSGRTLSCLNGISNDCLIHVIFNPNPIPVPPPPSTVCPSSFSYNPATPQLNQPFQVIFPIPPSLLTTSLNGDIVTNYQFTFITGNQVGNFPVVVNNGNWVISYGAVSGQTNWTLLQKVGGSSPTCKTDTLFGLTGGKGNNPCSLGPGGGCLTALGFIPTTVKDFSAKILTIAIGLAGGIAFILMVIGAIRVLASSGDPKAVGAGREMFVAAVAGLLFLIFAVLILQFIGLNILKYVPGIG